jgi:hypothetical protein
MELAIAPWQRPLGKVAQSAIALPETPENIEGGCPPRHTAGRGGGHDGIDAIEVEPDNGPLRLETPRFRSAQEARRRSFFSNRKLTEP